MTKWRKLLRLPGSPRNRHESDGGNDLWAARSTKQYSGTILAVDPADLSSKVVDLVPTGVWPGDWDVAAKPFDRTVKYRSVLQRFCGGMKWEYTKVFLDYTQRLAAGECPRGCTSLDELSEYYYVNIDGLYQSMRLNGWLFRRDELPYVHIGRDGQVLIGKEGNHRLAIAKLLGLRKLHVEVRAIHSRLQPKAMWRLLRTRACSIRLA